MNVPKHLALDRNDFGTIFEIEQVCLLTFCSLLAKVQVATEYPKTRNSPLKVKFRSGSLSSC